MMFGLNEALMSFIRRQMGLRSDTASAGGSLHAKVGEARNYLFNTVNNKVVQMPRGPVARGSFSTSATEYQTALSINGKGKLMGIYMRGIDSSVEPYCRITIDDVLILGGGSTSNQPSFPIKNFLIVGTNVFDHNFHTDGDILNAQIEFKESLKIEFHVNQNSGNIYWLYTLE